MLGAVGQFDAGFVEAFDSSALEAHGLDVISVVLLKVRVLQAGAFDTPWVRWLERCQNVSLGGIVDASALLLRPEVVDHTVGLGVEQVV